ncbi:MAG: hypothetical protein ACJ71T_10540 [Actinomycetales bacterium]
MPVGTTQLDPALLRVLLRRLGELEAEAHDVTDAVLGYLPNAGPGIAQATVAELASGLTDAFTTLGDSVAVTRRAAGRNLPQRPVEIDLTLVRDLDEVTAVTGR